MNRIKFQRVSYSKVTGKFRTKVPVFAINGDHFDQYLKSNFKGKIAKNLHRMLFYSLSSHSFGYSGDPERKTRTIMFELLKTYKVDSFTLFLPVYKEQMADAREIGQTLQAYDRAVKTSGELGLHLRRCNPKCRPFRVLLDLEATANNP